MRQLELVARVNVYEFCLSPAADEGHRAGVSLEQFGEYLGRLGVGGAARAVRQVNHRRIPQREVLAAVGRAVVIHHVERLPDQSFGVLGGVGYRRRTKYELRTAAHQSAQPSEPSENVRYVRAEDAAIDVRLVQDDVLQPAQRPIPGAMVGQDSEVQHIRVGYDDVRAAADSGPVRSGGVAVEDGVSDAARAFGFRHERGQFLLLVLRQRLCRVEVERARRPVFEKRFEDGQVVAHTLAAGRRGRHYDVPPVPQLLYGLRLVGVEAGYADALQPPNEARVKRRI